MKKALPFLLLSRFSRALSHELRTPLSVISNELYVLKADGADVSAAQSKVGEIDNLLTKIQSFLKEQSNFEEINVGDVFSGIEGVQVEEKAPLLWSGERELLTLSLEHLLRISISLGSLSSPVIEIDSSGAFLSLKVSQDFERESLISHALSPSGSIDTALLPIIDALLLLHGIVLKRTEDEKVLFVQEGL